MTETTEKLRAVFLTALMLGSVFAAGIAFTGSAAASPPDSVTVTQDPVEFAVGDTNYVEVVVENESVETGNITDSNWAVYDRTGALISGASISTADNGSIRINVGQDMSGEGTLTLFGENYTITTTSSTVANTSTNQTARVGEKVALVDMNNPGVTVTYYEDGTQTRTRGLGEGSVVRVFDTEGLDTDTEFSFQFGSNDDTREYLSLLDLGLSAELSSGQVEPSTNFTVTATTSPIDRNILVEVMDGDDAVVSNTGQIDSDGNAEVEIQAPAEDGNYTVVVTDIETGITVEKNLTVQTVTGQVNLGDSINEQRGDVVSIPVELNGATQASITVGSDDVNYVANVTVTDGNGDGMVTLQWNTYTAGRPDAGTIFSVAATPEDEDSDSVRVDDNGALSNVIADGTYDVFANVGNATYDVASQDISTVYLQQRSTGDSQVWTAPGSLADDEILGSDHLTQDTEISSNDYVVHQVTVSGVYGLIQNQSGDSTTAKFEAAVNSGALDLSIEQTEGSTGPNQDAATLDVSSALGTSVTVYTNSSTNNVYLVSDVSELSLTRNEDSFSAVGMTLNSTFTVTESSMLASSSQTSSAEFSVVEPSYEVTYEGDTLQVANADNQTISGTSNLAPGTEFTLRVQSTSTPGEPFILRDETVVVQEDGTWTASVDFTSAAVNSTFNANLRLNGGTKASAEGTVVESVDDGTTTDNGTSTTDGGTTTSTSTTDGGTTTSDGGTSTSTSTSTTSGGSGSGDGSGSGVPGFGVGIALVAVLGAALLALREN